MRSKSQRWHLCCSPNWQVWSAGCPFWLKKRIFFAFWRESVEKSSYPHAACRDILKAVSLDWPEYEKCLTEEQIQTHPHMNDIWIFWLICLLDGVNVKKRRLQSEWVWDPPWEHGEFHRKYSLEKLCWSVIRGKPGERCWEEKVYQEEMWSPLLKASGKSNRTQ